MGLPITAGCDTAWIWNRVCVVKPQVLRCSAFDCCATREPLHNRVIIWRSSIWYTHTLSIEWTSVIEIEKYIGLQFWFYLLTINQFIFDVHDFTCCVYIFVQYSYLACPELLCVRVTGRKCSSSTGGTHSLYGSVQNCYSSVSILFERLFLADMKDKGHTFQERELLTFLNVKTQRRNCSSQGTKRWRM